MYVVKGNNSAEPSYDEVARAARKLGYALRPWVERQENRQQENRGYVKQDNRGYGGPRFTPNGNTGACTPNRRQIPIKEVKCWTCGKLGHYASDCTTTGPKFAFAPKMVRIICKTRRKIWIT